MVINKFTIIGVALLILAATSLVMFWGSIRAVAKNVTNTSCSKADLNYEPLFIMPPGIPLTFNKPQFKRARDCQPLVAYFKNSASESQIAEILGQLKQNKNIYEVDYMSKRETIENYKEINKNSPFLLEGLPPGDIFPASAELFIDYAENKDQIALDLKSNELVDMVIGY